MNWTEFLREISLLILLDRSNNHVKGSEARRASIPPHLSNAQVVSSSKSSRVEIASPSSSILSNPRRLVLPNISYDESFRKHAKVLKKLNRKEREEDSKRKQLGTSINFTILENIEKEENGKLPKLKPNARDDRRTITDPWTSVADIQQLRNELILVKTTSFRMIKT